MTELIVSLDVTDRASLDRLLGSLEGHADFFKVGLVPFLAWGPDLVRRLRKKGNRVFLDLKFFDIPNTVRLATRFACDMGVEMVNLHMAGGSEMAAAAIAARIEAGGLTKILGVTVLTSCSPEDLAAAGVGRSVKEQVLAFARAARAGGLDGIVCSVEDLAFLRPELPRPFLTVCPGVRPSGPAGDQKRTGTAAMASAMGADYIVVGRPVIESADPAAAVEQILGELAGHG